LESKHTNADELGFLNTAESNANVIILFMQINRILLDGKSK